MAAPDSTTAGPPHLTCHTFLSSTESFLKSFPIPSSNTRTTTSLVDTEAAAGSPPSKALLDQMLSGTLAAAHSNAQSMRAAVTKEPIDPREIANPAARAIYEALLAQEQKAASAINAPSAVKQEGVPTKDPERGSHGMVLRPRNRDPASGAAVKKEKRGAAVKTEIATEVSAATQHDLSVASSAASTSTPAAIITSPDPMTPKNLVTLCNLLPLTPDPFTGIPMDALCLFLSALVDETTSPPDTHTAVLRAVAAAACMAHASFPVSAVSDGLVDSTISHFNRAVWNVTKDVAAVTSAKEVPSAILRTVECLRSLSQHFAAIVSTTSIVSEENLIRLEETAGTLVYLPTRAQEKQLASSLSDYVVGNAVYLFGAVWNQLPTNRESALQSTVQRVPWANPHALLRTATLPSGEKVLPATMMIMACVQSFAPEKEPNASTYILQIRTCVAFLMDVLTTNGAESPDASLALLTLMAEDLCVLLALPDFPAADTVLRLLLFSLARAYLRPSDTAPPTTKVPTALLEKMRCAAVTIVGKAALALLRFTTKKVIEYSSAAETDLQDWSRLLRGDVAEDKQAKKKRRKEKKEAPPAEEQTELSMLQRVQCSIYCHITSRQRTLAAYWGPIRTCYVLQWSQDKFIPSEAIEPLLKKSAVTPLQLDEEALPSMCQFAASHARRSLLHPDAPQQLMALIFSVFRDGGEGPGWDSARKKAMNIITVLLDQQPQLLTFAWPIIRQSVCDETARVREACIPLLQTLLAALLSNFKPDQLALTTSAFSAMLHLLSDKSSVVITKAISSLESLLCGPTAAVLSSTVDGMSLVKFAQTKLLLIFEDESNKKHQQEVARIFGHRWFAEEPATAALAGSVSESDQLETLCLEVVHLATFVLQHPYDVADNHPLISLLRMLAAANSASTSGDAKVPRPKRRAGGAQVVEGLTIHRRMKSLCKLLVQWIQAPMPKADPGAVMATLHLLSITHSEWVLPVVDAITGFLAFPGANPNKSSETSPTTEFNETSAVVLLQACRAIRVVVANGGSGAAVSVETIAAAFTAILAKYIGHFQQKIILAAAGGLAAMIEPSGSTRPSSRFLILNYVLMNQYYNRILSMIPTLQSSEQNVAYTLRFVFLLSEFLRLYPGWVSPHKELEDDSITGAIPNRLTKGEGICENVNSMLHQLVAKMPAQSAQRTMTIIMRAFGSLCILAPATYFRRNVTHITNALNPASDASVQTQGLLLLKDFLTDEEARILKSVAAKPQQDTQNAKTADMHETDHNSGMATWLMQQFHKQVLYLAGSNVRNVRVAAFDVIELSVHQGLQPPSTSAEVLIAICGDPQSDFLRPRIVRLLHMIADRHEDVIPTRACSGVIRSFDLIAASGQNPILAVAQEATDVTPQTSFHDVVYKALSKLKKNRESFLVGIMRLFYQEAKLEEWTAQRVAAVGDHRYRSQSEIPSAAGSLVEPATLLIHLGLHVASLPLVHVTEALYIMEQVRVALDLVGQVTLEALEAMPKKQPQQEPPYNIHTVVEVARGVGLVVLHYAKSFIKKEYGLTAAKARNATAAALLASREPNSKASAELNRRCSELHEAIAPIRKWLAAGETEKKVFFAAIARLVEELQSTMEEHGKETFLTESSSTVPESRGLRTVNRRRRVVESASSSSSSSSSSDDDDDEE